MENASKALIIAGAILISILLISLGILIYNQASNITSGDQMSEIEVTSFNQKFLQYEGTQNGSKVKSLIQQVVSSNANAENEERPIEVTGTISGHGTQINTSAIKNNSKYTVSFTYGNGTEQAADKEGNKKTIPNGLIGRINIQ